MHPRLQALLPQRALSRLIGLLGRLERPRFVVRAAIRAFARHYRVDLAEAARPLDRYVSFTDFFTRGLIDGARPLPAGAGHLAAPADGIVAAAGRVAAGELIQAKGIRFPAARLLGDDALATRFDGGWYHTTYLAPRDYHRVHAPWSGVLRRRVHHPGRLFSVAPDTVERLPVLAINERVTLLFTDERIGEWALVMVGALIVGGIATVWEGAVNPLPAGGVADRRFDPGTATVGRGGEVGRFYAGSTVIVLFPPGRVELEPAAPGDRLRVGRTIGRVIG